MYKTKHSINKYVKLLGNACNAILTLFNRVVINVIVDTCYTTLITFTCRSPENSYTVKGLFLLCDFL